MSRIEVALRLCINSSTSKFFHSLSFPGSKPDCRGGRTADFCQTYIHSQCSHCPLDSDIDVLYCAPTPRQRYEGCLARTFFISRLNMCLTREDFPTPDLRTVSHFKKRRSRKVLTLPTTRIRNLLMIEKDRKSFKVRVHTWDTASVSSTLDGKSVWIGAMATNARESPMSNTRERTKPYQRSYFSQVQKVPNTRLQPVLVLKTTKTAQSHDRRYAIR